MFQVQSSQKFKYHEKFWEKLKTKSKKLLTCLKYSILFTWDWDQLVGYPRTAYHKLLDMWPVISLTYKNIIADEKTCVEMNVNISRFLLPGMYLPP